MKFLFSLLLLVCSMSMAQQAQSFEVKEGEFLLDGKPMKVYSGEIHYPRIPREYWKQRLQMVKAMGLNTIATYVFWNYHNSNPGVWDWSNDNHNLREYLKTAQEVGLYVILRPGPYVCGEWDFGGYPWWYSLNKEMVIRSNNKPFLDSCKNYLTQLREQVKGLHISEGGPIIMTQIENEFGSYVAQRKDIPLEEHKAYSKAIETILYGLDFKPPYFTSDGSWLFNGGSVAGVLPTANGEDDVVKLKKLVNEYHGGKGPYMVAEFYPGWLDHWAEPFPKVATEQVVAQTKKYLDGDVNFNFYMVHGGTNFAYTSGANYDKEHDIQPNMTSYDYDAPISEAGWATEKYKALRELMIKSVPYKVPEIPKAAPVIKLADIKLATTADFFAWKKAIKPVYADTPQTFETLGQANGYVLYSRRFTQPIEGKLKIKGLRDYATVYVNGKKVGTLNRYHKQYEMDIDLPFNARLDILVESMGRINYGKEIINNLKGIIAPITIDENEITGSWEMYAMPLEKAPVITPNSAIAKTVLAAFYSGSFNLQQTGDTFLDMSEWGKGVVFVNGHNLGRYWSVGPQQTLYLPGCWLKKGKNEVVVFEQQNDKIQTVLQSTTTPVLEKLK
jgi:beta-galactosidase